MKRLAYSVLAIFCFAVVSCTTEIPMPDYGEDYIVLNVFNSPMTMAEGSTDYERQLNRLDCFFYVKDKTDEPCVYYHKAEVNDLGSATIPFYVNDLVLKEIFPSGSLCDVFVIANIPGDPTFKAKTEETTMEALGRYVLDMTAGEYDGIGKPFVMTGSARVQKGKNSSATADIKLARVASKVTMKVKVPKLIEVKNSDGVKVAEYYPVLEDDKGNVTLKTSFNYGANKGYLSGASLDDPDNKNFITTDKISYTRLEDKDDDDHYVFTCDMPFYTYARSWDKGSSTAAYVTFEMPWRKDKNEDSNGVADEYKTYYYQILINGKDRNFVPNTHYDMTVTVGVLGSTVESLPAELDVWSYYILDWTHETNNDDIGSGDRDEDVEIQKFNYLEVPQTYIEMDNVSEVAIRYNASHKIGVEFAESKDRWVVGLKEGTTTKETAFYIENGSATPTVAKITDIVLKDNFVDNNKGWLTFNYTLSDAVYSPAYVFITIWLDIDGDGEHDSDEILTEDVTIVIYPAIYIIGDNSATYSIFVNGNYNSGGSGGGNVSSLTIAGQAVGKAAGTLPNEYPNSTYMHIITISAFNENNYKFAYNNNKNKDTEYVIGDPRVRRSYKLDVPDQNTTTPQTAATGWIKATDVNGIVRNLEFYYPTSTDYQVIAPKFRISSMLGGYSSSSPTGAARRCASYQEHGFPAGRWRLPTTAEILYIVELQRLGKIETLFFDNKTYLSATDRIAVDGNNNYTLNYRIGTANASVRCVYDDWYWGSEREAIANSSLNNRGGYQFTWGDRKVY